MPSTEAAVTSELPKIHPISQAGFGQGKAELYDAARSSYAPEVLSYIRKALGGRSNLKIVEIGSGSGKFTRALLDHPVWKHDIAELRCVEPNEGMRNVFTKTVDDSRVSLKNGTFDDTGVADGWADFIVVATAFNWCLQLEEAIKEFRRVLNSECVVCFLWNPEDTTKATWLQQAYDILMPKHKGFTWTRDGFQHWRGIFDLPLYKQNFTEPEETSISYVEPSALEKIIARFMTWSGIAVLPDEEKVQLREQLREIIERGDGLIWIDEQQRIFEVPFESPIVIFRRRRH